MKKAILALACVATAMSMSAQRASDSDLSYSEIKSYNRIGISYNNTHYGFNDAYGKDHDDNNFGLNGIGIDYIHGFALSESLPIYLETGLNFNFNFGTKSGDKEDIGYKDYWMQSKTKRQDINMQIPVNFGYKFAVSEDASIMPYVGLNFKVHFSTRYKDDSDTNMPKDMYDPEDADWISVFDDGDDAMGDKDYTWNRFQMGWHVGVGFQYKPIYLGVQYGTDFIGAYKHKFDDETAKISTGNLKISLGYVF
ncbi:MAG: porin family protein [Candidatus Amulumruptor caecigallinarius]|nr:porin family protein [Candidatus Amulumruptor caecigallinarius]MCM1396611.1 porin family protein [Candidatus Amulumruptor caecigallinarius]MCM1453331.1 porin family protein [bacterium]